MKHPNAPTNPTTHAAKPPMNRSTPSRLRRYRQRNRRYEFYPSPDVADIIEHHLQNGSEKCIAGVLDGLIRAGHRAVTGNGRAK